MSDEEDYNSEEDADYVPSEGELGSEEENSGEEEDLSALTADGEPASQTTKRTRGKKIKSIALRKRKGGIKLGGEEATDAKEENDVENTELAEKIKETAVQKKEENEKKRADDLWASFLSDVQPSPRRPPSSASTPTSMKESSSQTNKAASGKPAEISIPKSNGEKVTITKVFDFAGEEIKITKEVDANSKEAKAELKKQHQSVQAATAGSTTSSPAASTTSSTPTAGLPAIGVKRPTGAAGGLGSVLGKIGKKQKMGTLEKSKLDWESFKQKEGIVEDLKIHNKGKDGYIERMAFLNRTDVRQFEIERDLRLSKSGKR